MSGKPGVFCEEPWTGLFSIDSDGSVVFCPCYAKLKIGNLSEATIHELWNAPELLDIRRSFVDGRIPVQCRDQLCPVVVEAGKREGEETEGKA